MTTIGLLLIVAGGFTIGAAWEAWRDQRRQERWTAEDAEAWLSSWEG